MNGGLSPMKDRKSAQKGLDSGVPKRGSKNGSEKK